MPTKVPKAAAARQRLLEILSEVATTGEPLDEALTTPEATRLLTQLARGIVLSVLWPSHVDKQDPEHDALAALYASLKRIDPQRPAVVQLTWMVTILRGAVMDYARRHADRLREDPHGVRSTLSRSRRDREAIASQPTVTAPSAEDLVQEKLAAEAISWAITSAAVAHPECKTCSQALTAVTTGHITTRTYKNVQYHIHLLHALLDY